MRHLAIVLPALLTLVASTARAEGKHFLSNDNDEGRGKNRRMELVNE